MLTAAGMSQPPPPPPRHKPRPPKSRPPPPPPRAPVPASVGVKRGPSTPSVKLNGQGREKIARHGGEACTDSGGQGGGKKVPRIVGKGKFGRGVSIRKPVVLRDVTAFQKKHQVGQGTYG